MKKPDDIQVSIMQVLSSHGQPDLLRLRGDVSEAVVLRSRQLLVPAFQQGQIGANAWSCDWGWHL